MELHFCIRLGQNIDFPLLAVQKNWILKAADHLTTAVTPAQAQENILDYN